MTEICVGRMTSKTAGREGIYDNYAEGEGERHGG
jgi:hypothetical protein